MREPPFEFAQQGHAFQDKVKMADSWTFPVDSDIIKEERPPSFEGN